MTRFDLLPMKGQILASINFVRDRMTTFLLQHFCYRLPAEICRCIAGYLVRPYCSAVTLSSRPSQPLSLRVTTTRKIWAQFVKFHDKVYISSLSNTEYKTSRAFPSALIYSPTTHAGAINIYIAYDSWGIRNVLFASLNADVRVGGRDNVWWQTMTLQQEFDQLIMESDVSLSWSLCPLTLTYT